MALPASKTKALKTLSLIARQAVFTQDASLDSSVGSPIDSPTDSSESTLVKADASIFHPLPDTLMSQEPESLDPAGYDAGFAAGQAQSERVFKETITMMEGVLAGLQSDLSDIVKAIEHSHARAIRASLSAVLPQLAQDAMISEIERVLIEASQSALDGKIEARIHPENMALKQYIEEHHAQDITLALDMTQTASGVSFVWNGGGVDIDPVGVAQSCMTLIRSEERDGL